MLDQVVPALIVRSIVPPAPTTIPMLSVAKETPIRSAVDPAVWTDQRDPPLVVWSIVPLLPTMNPLDALVKTRALRDSDVTADCAVQSPPLILRTIEPESPTAVPLAMSTR